MDAFVFPSVFEGLGLALIEAQASGLQVYASRNVIPQIVKMSNGFNFISLNETPKEWAKIIIKNIHYNRNEMYRETVKNIQKNGYDINLEIKKIQQYFERN